MQSLATLQKRQDTKLIVYGCNQRSTTTTYTVDLLVAGLGAIEFHFQVVDPVTNLHILKHISGKLAFQLADFFFDELFIHATNSCSIGYWLLYILAVRPRASF